MSQNYFPPAFRTEHFHCPYCNVYAAQRWENFINPYYNAHYLVELQVSRCAHCMKNAYWFDQKMIVPDTSSAPLPHPDLPDDSKLDYNEAASILSKSPRGAAALLRLSIQKLMVHLGEKGKNINDDIASLVRKGLPEEVQQALDIVRVIGNESLHPGTLDLKDNHETALQLFGLINFIVEERITRKKKIATLFGGLPEMAKTAIADRDSK